MLMFEDDAELFAIAGTFIVAAAIVTLIAYLATRKWDPDQPSQKRNEATENEYRSSKNGAFLDNRSKRKEKWKHDKNKEVQQYTHQWLITNLKGHTDRVLDFDFASNGKHLVSCGEDRSLMLWSLKDLHEKSHKSVRGTVHLDHARFVKFAPDSKSIILAMAVTNNLSVYKLVRKDDGSHSVKFQQVESVEFPNKHSRDIVSIGIDCTGKYLMSASSNNELVLYNLHGEVLKTVETKLNTLHRASISPCGRFVAVSGFTPDVLVWEVLFDRSGNFQGINRAYELKGHTSGVYAFDFNQNASRAVTASKDGSWKLFDTDVRYQLQEEPRELCTGSWDELKSTIPESVFAVLTPSGDSFAIGTKRHVRIYSAHVNKRAEEGEEEEQFEPLYNIHSDHLTAVKFSVCGKYLATSGDRQIRLFHNVPGYYSRIESLKVSLRNASGDAQRRRLQEQITEIRQQLDAILKS